MSEMEGIKFLGTHLIIEAWGCSNLGNESIIKEMMIESVKEAGATLLSIHLHEFPGGGITGIAILAESHMSYHDWPEYGAAMIDIYCCGEAEPSKALPVIQKYLKTNNINTTEIKRGVIQ